MNAIKRFPILLFAAILSACVTSGPPDARPGLNDREMHALEETYYWQPEFGVPSYSDSALSQLLAGTADNTQNGERSEEHASDIALALASVGDDRFSASLSKQSKYDQKAISREIAYLWTGYGLRYPKTQKLLREYRQPLN